MLTADKSARVEAIVHEQIHAILREQSRDVPKLSAKDKLSDTLGLSSLDLATLISELELALDADPFAELVPVTSLRTVGDLVQAYRLALQPGDALVHRGQDLSPAMARAHLRRTRRKK
jgi:acyl carrier protein